MAYAERFGVDDDAYDLVTFGRHDAGTQLVEAYAREIGVEPVALADVSARHYASALLHSYAHWSDLPALLAAIRADRVDYFGDGLRNEMRFRRPHPAEGTRPRTVYFGYTLENGTVRRELGSLPHETVAFDDLAGFWRWLARVRPLDGRTPSQVLRSTDLLVAMRYWGSSRMYPMRHALAAADLLRDLDIPQDIDRIIVRPDPRSLVGTDRIVERIRTNFDGRIEVVRWSDVIDDAPHLGLLDLLDRYAYAQEEWGLGSIFAFDGTPNVLVAATQPSCAVIWPSRRLVHRYISERSAARAAAETVRIQREVVAQLLAGIAVPHVRTAGRVEAAVLDSISPGASSARSGWTDPDVDAVRLAVLDVTGLPDSATASEAIARLRGLLDDRIRFERLASKVEDPAPGPEPAGPVSSLQQSP